MAKLQRLPRFEQRPARVREHLQRDARRGRIAQVGVGEVRAEAADAHLGAAAQVLDQRGQLVRQSADAPHPAVELEVRLTEDRDEVVIWLSGSQVVGLSVRRSTTRQPDNPTTPYQ